jgi:predicted small integral membrane protein
MIEARITKVIMVASLALFALLVTFDNLTDYDTNYAFVSHVLSMDTTFPGNALMYRAITSPRAMAGRLCADHRGRGGFRYCPHGRRYRSCLASAL